MVTHACTRIGLSFMLAAAATAMAQTPNAIPGHGEMDYLNGGIGREQADRR